VELVLESVDAKAKKPGALVALTALPADNDRLASGPPSLAFDRKDSWLPSLAILVDLRGAVTARIDEDQADPCMLPVSIPEDATIYESINLIPRAIAA
jgi:hypothetical protein